MLCTAAIIHSDSVCIYAIQPETCTCCCCIPCAWLHALHLPLVGVQG